MSLTLVTTPYDDAGVRDPLHIELQCNGFRTSAATTASYTITVATNPSDGYSFTLSLPTGDLVFTFTSGTPDDSGTEVQIGATAAATRTNLFDALRANWWVDQLFVLVNTTVITLTARAPGYVPVGFINTTPATLSWTQVGAGADAAYQPNYSAVLQLWVEEVYGSNTFTPLPALQLRPPKETRRVSADLSTSLVWRDNYEWPSYGSTGLTVLSKLKRRWYATYYEQHGDPPAPRSVVRTAIKQAWNAGSRNIEHQDLQNIFSLIRRSDVLNPFLTHRGRAGRNEVSEHQDHYVSWYRRVAKVNDSQLHLFCTVFYKDGTNSSTTIWTDTNGSGWTQWKVGQFAVGFRRVGLHLLQPTKEPTHYQVTLRNAANTALSETLTFHVVQTDANEIYVEYVNSFGVVESLRCQGAWEQALAPEHETLKRQRFSDNGVLPSLQESDLVATLSGANMVLRVSTGLMDRGELNAVLDVLVSPAWRWVDTERGTRHPLRLVGSEQVMRKQGTEDEHLYGLELEFAVGDEERAWSDRTSWPPMPTEPEEERSPQYAP